MNVISDAFKQLVERKLWPVALLLVVALVAIPMLLAKDPEPASLPSATAPVSGTTPASDESLVSVADAGKADRVRAVLGDRKDPFRPAQVHHVKQPDDLVKDVGSSASAGGDAAGSASSSGGGTQAPSETASPEQPDATPSPTATPKPPSFDLYSLEVRFGPADGDLVTRTVKRLTGLPGGTQPAALYLGLMGDHKRAVFIVDAGVEVLGDGHCDPSPEDCQTLTLRKGETEFLTRGDKQYELDLVDIHLKRTDDAKEAIRTLSDVAVNGRRNLRRLHRRARSFRYDATAGALKRVARPARAGGAGAVFKTTG